MAYGDALGFYRENNKENKNPDFKPFTYFYSKDIELQAEKGQWSYLTQLMLINCKCLVAHKEKMQVSVDYKRMVSEIKLWKYYRYGMPSNYMHKFNLGKAYYEDEFYWNDKRGEAFSRIFPIALANKNFSAAQEEVYKNIIYINRHPQVVLAGLLLLRTIYFLTNNTVSMSREGLVDELKSYLIQLQLTELEEYVKGQLPNNYKIKFEQEKINYLMDLDRIKNSNTWNYNVLDSKSILILSLVNFFRIYEDENNEISSLDLDDKEMYTILYGLLALSKNTIKIKDMDQIQDLNFIESMGEYLLKLREYEIGRRLFEKTQSEINLFKLEQGAVVKHPLLNNIRVKEKKLLNNYIEIIIESKSGEYRFIGAKK